MDQLTQDTAVALENLLYEKTDSAEGDAERALQKLRVAGYKPDVPLWLVPTCAEVAGGVRGRA